MPTARRLGIAEHIRFHDLRHSCASMMIAPGFEPFRVSRWLGHQGLDPLACIYRHLYPADYESKLARYERIVAEG